jgi:MFS family permease
MLDIVRRLCRLPVQFRRFIQATFFLGIAGGIFEAIFNNFLSDTHQISAVTRGLLEFPRELPGFLVVVTTGLFFFLPETALAAGAAFVIGLGMIGLAVFGSDWWLMVVFMVLWSAGIHLLMPLTGSITMHLADADNRGTRLGQVRAAGIAASAVGCGSVWGLMQYAHLSYATMFLLGGCASILAGIVFLRIRLPGAHLKRPRWIWRREYWLFYVLAVLFGARKQVFITFGPWVLIRLFDQPAHVIAKLWIASALIGIVFQPLLGRLIDRLGERTILMADSVCVFLVCTGYGLSHLVPDPRVALWLLYACFIGDLLLFGVNMARTTYLSRIVERPDHVAPTLSLGVSLNHAVSMCVPMLGGLLWVAHGHQMVFACAAGVAVVMLIFSSMIRVPGDGLKPLIAPAAPK